MNKVKIGIIGIGNMGSAHATSIFDGKIPGMELGAVCDIADNKLEWAKEKLPEIPLYKDYKEMIASGNVNAVLVATPHYDHPTITIYCLEHGMHTICEKPAGVYTKQVREMNEVAQKHNELVFSLMYNQRTNPLYQKMRELVLGGAIGEPKRFIWIITNWYRSQHYYNSGTWRATWAGEGGGVLLNQCPHNLDLWQWIFGMPKKITGHVYYGKYHNVEVEDDVTAFAEYENGATALFVTTTGELPGTNRLEITGDRGKLVAENETLTFYELEQSERKFCYETKESFTNIPTTKIVYQFPNSGEGHNGILKNFTNAVLHGEKLIAPGVEGINGLTISNAVYLSDWTKSMVELPVDEELFYKLLSEKVNDSHTKKEVESEIVDVQGTFNDRWNVKW